jgi:hypothetical protein
VYLHIYVHGVTSQKTFSEILYSEDLRFEVKDIRCLAVLGKALQYSGTSNYGHSN